MMKNGDRTTEMEAAADAAVPTTVTKTDTTKTPTPAAELLRRDAGDIDATTVTMERSGADHVRAERVIMTRSGAQTLEARSAQLDRSGVVQLHSERAVVHAGSVLVAATDELRMVNSKALVTVAGNLTAEGTVRTGIYIGPAATGIEPVVDSRGAAAFGAALATVLVLIWRLLGRR